MYIKEENAAGFRIRAKDKTIVAQKIKRCFQGKITYLIIYIL